ncbi:hypothetical protein Tcan_14944 [Toxocara canis]|uniref:Uncharacterized protein n=1 Tax=Toxocara canis TaxID=6265 RepID=A0A0B2V5C2_TOXCA|nr:hypothetical protein Tcan_14944 [Toxocara canis]
MHGTRTSKTRAAASRVRRDRGMQRRKEDTKAAVLKRRRFVMGFMRTTRRRGRVPLSRRAPLSVRRLVVAVRANSEHFFVSPSATTDERASLHTRGSSTRRRVALFAARTQRHTVSRHCCSAAPQVNVLGCC